MNTRLLTLASGTCVSGSWPLMFCLHTHPHGTQTCPPATVTTAFLQAQGTLGAHDDQWPLTLMGSTVSPGRLGGHGPARALVLSLSLLHPPSDTPTGTLPSLPPFPLALTSHSPTHPVLLSPSSHSTPYSSLSSTLLPPPSAPHSSLSSSLLLPLLPFQPLTPPCPPLYPSPPPPHSSLSSSPLPPPSPPHSTLSCPPLPLCPL